MIEGGIIMFYIIFKWYHPVSKLYHLDCKRYHIRWSDTCFCVTLKSNVTSPCIQDEMTLFSKGYDILTKKFNGASCKSESGDIYFFWSSLFHEIRNRDRISSRGLVSISILSTS